MGLVLVGMPGLEKRLSRYPQLYSRVGFVHEFRPLSQADVWQLLREGWGPPDVLLSDEVIDEDALTMLIRVSDGRFRTVPSASADQPRRGNQPVGEDHPRGRRGREGEPSNRDGIMATAMPFRSLQRDGKDDK